MYYHNLISRVAQVLTALALMEPSVSAKADGAGLGEAFGDIAAAVAVAQPGKHTGSPAPLSTTA